MDKIDKDGENLCRFKYALSKLIVNLGTMEMGEPRFPSVHPILKILWQRFRIDKVYTDIKIANNTKINNILISFTDH